MTISKEEFEKQVDALFDKCDSIVSPEYFKQQLRLYTENKEGAELDLNLPTFGYAVFRESIRISIMFTASLLRESFGFED